MKKFISKVNTILLEKHPILWNTRLIWMAAISIFIHICFFIAGYISVTNVETLHERGATELFFNNGSVFFGILISILLLTIWLIYLFKNNAFKSFYPTSKFSLFKQFLCYLIIIFSATSFYYSYLSGVKLCIHNSYSDDQIAQEIDLMNNAALFFSHNLTDYTLDKLRYPAPFDSLFCENRRELINYNKLYYSSFGKDYQFYNLKTKTYFHHEKYVDSTFRSFVKSEYLNSKTVYYFKDSVVDIAPYLITTKPSYYHLSNTFFSEKGKTGDNGYYGDYYSEDIYYDKASSYDYGAGQNRNTAERNKKNHELLKRNNPEEIKRLLTDFLELASTYKISHNLDSQTWFDLVYGAENFEIRALIRRLRKETNNNRIFDTQVELNEFQSYVNKIQTDYHIETGKLFNTYENIYDIKDQKIFNISIHFYLWITFLLSGIVFAFRVSGLKPLLFSVIVGGLLFTFTALVGALYQFLYDIGGREFELFLAYFVLILGTIILAIPLFLMDKVKKIVSGVFLNISIVGFVLYVFLIVVIIDIHQTKACSDQLYLWSEQGTPCFQIIGYLKENLSYLLFAVGLLFIYSYSGTIKKWQGLPEN